jgi:hypothetical protein
VEVYGPKKKENILSKCWEEVMIAHLKRKNGLMAPHAAMEIVMIMGHSTLPNFTKGESEEKEY